MYRLVIAIVIVQENLSSSAATFIVGLFQSMYIYYPIRLSIKFAPATFRSDFLQMVFAFPVRVESVMYQSRCSTRLDAGICNIDKCIAEDYCRRAGSAYGHLNCIQVWSTQSMFSLYFIQKHHVKSQNKLYFLKSSTVNID